MSHSLSKPGFAQMLDAGPRAHNRFAELIARYPNLSEPQIEQLIGVFPRLGALDLALMMSDDNLGPRLEAFCSAHRELISPSLADYAVIGAILALPVMVAAAFVLSGLG